MTPAQAELIDMKGAIAGLRAELNEVEADAWKDGELDDTERFDIQQLNDLIAMAEDHILRLEIEIEEEEAQMSSDEGDAALDEQLDDLIDDVEDDIDDIIDEAERAADKEVDDAERDANDALDEAERAAQDAIDDLIDDIEDDIDDIIDEAERAADKEVDDAERDANDAIDDAERDSNDALDEAERAAREVVEEAERAANEVIDEAEQASSEAESAAQADAPPPTVAKDISGSVGQGGKNQADDVSAVQQLLNDKGDSLTVDGQVGPKTIGAISKFQMANLGFSDGRVDPGGQTWGALSGGAGGGASGGEATEQQQRGATDGEVAGESGGGDTSEPFVPPTEQNEPTLRKGDESVDGWVEYLQQMLCHHIGASACSVNGKFDQKTHQAVIQFQSTREPPLLVDGIVGNQTWSALRDDKQRAAVGTDGREPGTFVERGPEGRWGSESGDILTYDRSSDQLRMVVSSVGDEPIDDFKAIVFVDGKRRDIKIGKPEVTISTGAGHAHWVRVTEFTIQHGAGPFKIEAFLPPELGGDNWKGEFGEIPGGVKNNGVTVTVDVVNEDTAAPIEGAVVVIKGGDLSIETKTDSNGKVKIGEVEDGTYLISAKTQNDSQSDKLKVEGEDARHIFLMSGSGEKPVGKGHSITIDVVGKDTANPIPGAETVITGGPPGGIESIKTKTDGNGQVKIGNVEDGTFIINVTTENDSQSGELVVDGKDAHHVFLMNESTRRPGDIAKLKVGVFKNGDQTQPYAGALVALLELPSKTPSGAWSTDDNGFVFGIELAPGTYAVQVKTPSDVWTDESTQVTLEAGDDEAVLVPVHRQGAAMTTGHLDVSVVVETKSGNQDRPNGHKVHVQGADGKRRTGILQGSKALFSDLPIGEYTVIVEEVETEDRWHSAGRRSVKVEAFFTAKAEVRTMTATRITESVTTSIDVTVTRQRTPLGDSPIIIKEWDWRVGHAAPSDNQGEWVPPDGEAKVAVVKAHHRAVLQRRHDDAVASARTRIGYHDNAMGAEKTVADPQISQKDYEVQATDVDGSEVGNINVFVDTKGTHQTTLTFLRTD